MKYYVLPLVVALAACSNTPAPTTDEVMSSSSEAMVEVSSSSEATVENSLTFLGKSTLVDHPGGFTDFTVDVSAAEGAPFTEATMTVTIDTTSIYSDSDGLTGHLNKDDFFDTAKFPEAKFVSTKIEETGVNTYTVTGDLTLKGATKQVMGTATVASGVMTVNAELPRKEFGVGNDAYGEKLLAEMIPVTLVYQMQ